MSKILKIAHRGFTDNKTKENTINAFINAKNVGFDMIELDIQLCKNNIIVIYHDLYINNKFIKDLTYNELKKIDTKIRLKDIKKSLKIRNYRDKSRKNSPLLKSSDGIIVDTGKLKNITGMVNKISDILEKKIKDKYGS